MEQHPTVLERAQASDLEDMVSSHYHLLVVKYMLSHLNPLRLKFLIDKMGAINYTS